MYGMQVLQVTLVIFTLNIDFNFLWF